jgi:hypothetical protein
MNKMVIFNKKNFKIFFTGVIDHAPQIFLRVFSGDRACFLTFTAPGTCQLHKTLSGT